MNFYRTNEQNELCKEIIKFSKKNLNSKEEYTVFSREKWSKVAEFGLLGIVSELKYGGLQMDYYSAAKAMEALGYSCKNNGLIFSITNHIWVALHIIELFGTNFLKEKYLYNMIKGYKIGAFALTESDSGSDALAMRTFANKVSSGYIINGCKTFISNGPIADVFIVIAVTNEKPKKYSAFIIEKGMAGVKIGPEIPKMGLDSCPMSEIRFEDCYVPQEQLLGEEGMGMLIMNEVLTWERCYEFAPHIGTMQRIMEMCYDHINERRQSNHYLREFQSISHKISDMQVMVEMARNMLYKIAEMHDQGIRTYRESSIFKLYVSESYVKICKEAMQIFGAYGYTKEYEFEREMRDALACTIYSGTSEIQRNTIFNLISCEGIYD